LEYLLLEISQVTVKITNKLKQEYEQTRNFNPLPHRMLILLNELNDHVSYLLENQDISEQQLSHHLSVIYNDSSEINETYQMLKNIETINLTILINELKYLFTKLVTYVVEIFGEYKALYIIPPRYQLLSNLLRKL
jgi:hypothetical protein